MAHRLGLAHRFWLALSALLAMWTAKPSTQLTTSMIKDACAPLPKAKRVTPTTKAEGLRAVYDDRIREHVHTRW